MKFMKNCVFFLCLVSSSHGMTSEEIKTEVGTGCANKALFSSSFTTEKGDVCSECSFCSGSSLTSIFNPKSSSTCIDCGSNQNDCTNFQVVVSFDEDWRMWFVSILSSDGPIEDDPSKIIMEGSNDFNGKIGTWAPLYDSSGPVFNGRSEKKTMLFNNIKSYKQYRVTFVRNKNSSKMKVSHYGIIPAYTKQCTAELHEKLTGVKLSAELTVAPTSQPTTAAPTAPPLDNNSIKAAVDLWNSNESEAIEQYGPIENWNTSFVTSMRFLFNYYRTSNEAVKTFNADISKWDVSQVTNMAHMFRNAESFNANIGTWNVGNVSNMGYMFWDAKSFNADISAWQVGQVTDMEYMFYGPESFNADISAWQVGNVTNMNNMFWGAKSFNANIGAWQVGKVTRMVCMFCHNTHNIDLSAWDVSESTTMNSMFGSSSFNGDISSWNVEKVMDMAYMFSQANSFSVNLSDWEVSQVTSFQRMFYNAKNFDQKLCWNFDKASNVGDMFTRSKCGSTAECTGCK